MNTIIAVPVIMEKSIETLTAEMFRNDIIVFSPKEDFGYISSLEYKFVLTTKLYPSVIPKYDKGGNVPINLEIMEDGTPIQIIHNGSYVISDIDRGLGHLIHRVERVIDDGREMIEIALFDIL